MARPSILVAVAPAALPGVREKLGERYRLVEVHTLGGALERLARGGIDVTVAGLHFDDSLTPVLLDVAKAYPATREIPFICCRLLPTMLAHATLTAARQLCSALGAQFVDVLEIEQRAGAAAAGAELRAAVERACLNVD